ncbi:MAG: amidohydrolase family protein, partial [Gammaproteobacteria bacterium]
MTYAIDMHIHADADPRVIQGRAKEFHDAALKYFGAKHKHQSVDETADMYRKLDMMAVLLAVNSESGIGTCVTNDFVAAAQHKNPDVFIGFASVDPWAGGKATDDVKRAIEELGLKGFKFHPATQNFYPNEKQFYPIYEAIARYSVPI